MTPAERKLTRAAAALAAGRIDDAARDCAAVLARDAANGPALALSGMVAAARGDLAAAAGLLERAVSVLPEDESLRFDLGTVLARAGRTEAALAAFRAAAALDPGQAATHLNIGAMLLRLDRPDAALAAFDSAVLCAPRDAEAHRGRARALTDLRRGDEAVAAARRAAALAPADPEAQATLATALLDAGRPDAAEEAYRAALALAPDHLSALLGLALLEARRRRFSASEVPARAAVAAAPGDPRAHNALANALLGQGRIAEAVAATDALIAHTPARAPGRAVVASMAAMRRLYLDGRDAAATAADARAAAALIAAAVDPLPPAPVGDRDPERRLRIGYVSPDFRRHSVALFLQPVFERHDRTRFELFCYAHVGAPDPMTDWFRAAADGWRDVVGLPDAALAAQVRADAIDLLVDLAGHSDGNRLGAFAMRPAPVAATWLGYPGTTGLAAIDWRLSDAVCDPPAEDALSAERVWRLDPGFHVWAPPYEAPPVTALPGLAAPFTFGSYSSIYKFSDATVALWARVLAAVPEARLVLKSAVAEDPPACARLVGRFAAAGTAPARIAVRAPQWDVREHLATYAEIDAVLDPTPYNGTTTVCEGLWMGVPSIVLAGDRHSARVGASLMTQAGLPQFVARSADEYVAIAVRCAAARQRLAALRAGLRARLSGLALGDPAGFTRRLEAAFRGMWRDRVARGA